MCIRFVFPMSPITSNLASLGVIVPVAGVRPVIRATGEASAARPWGGACRRHWTPTWYRSGGTNDAETLYRDVIARNPGAWMVDQNLGTELAGRNRLGRRSTRTRGRWRRGRLRRRPKQPRAGEHQAGGTPQPKSPDRMREASIRHTTAVRATSIPITSRPLQSGHAVSTDPPDRQREAHHGISRTAVKIDTRHIVEAR